MDISEYTTDFSFLVGQPDWTVIGGVAHYQGASTFFSAPDVSPLTWNEGSGIEFRVTLPAPDQGMYINLFNAGNDLTIFLGSTGLPYNEPVWIWNTTTHASNSTVLTEVPEFFKIYRLDNVFVAEASSDGTTWNELFTTAPIEAGDESGWIVHEEVLGWADWHSIEGFTLPDGAAISEVYKKGRHRLVRVGGASELDIGMRLDETTLDEPIYAYEAVPVSVVTVTDGYTIGSNGEQSIDPATGSATLSEYVKYHDATTFLRRGDYVEGYYDQVLYFAGVVREVNVELEVDTSAARYGKRLFKRTTYQLSSMELILLQRTVSWDFLDEETALERLERWFTVDTAEVIHDGQLEIMMEAVDAGSSTLLDLARKFSEVTGITLRVALFRGPMFLEAFDNTVPRGDSPLEPVAGFEDASDWTNGVTYTNGVPTGVTVQTNNMRLLGGINTADVEQPWLDESFYLDSSRLDSASDLPVGFRSPQPIDVFGFTLPVLKVSQSFGKVYSASIELDASTAVEINSSIGDG